MVSLRTCVAKPQHRWLNITTTDTAELIRCNYVIEINLLCESEKNSLLIVGL